MSNNDLEILRHSASHIMAQAVKRLWPDVKLAIGPAIEDGFYYDFDKVVPFTVEDLVRIEEEMKKIVKENIPFKRRELTRAEALKLFSEKGEIYKVELINDLPDEQVLSVYEQGEFVDLCRGPHIRYSKELKAYKLFSATGAYWRGSEKNKMLSRIYGTAFNSKEDLEMHIKTLEEARQRDHTKLGKELGLYILSPLVGKGLPLFTPKGTTILRELQRWIEDEELKRGYQFTRTPILAKTDLYAVSGHLDHYRDKMFIFKTDEGEELALRPMTCPHQYMIYKAETRSYRDLPIRYSETSLLFRKELSGELHGLIRIWQFTLADAHIICRAEQLEEEFEKVLDFIQYIMKTIGLTDYYYRFSRWDPKNKDKYIDNPKAWAESESTLKKILDKLDMKYKEAENEAAFYGPKLDVQMKNVWGKEDTMFTVQIDFSNPEKFDLSYADKDNKQSRPMIIHRASIGCYERTLAMLIEKYAGNFPTWLSPLQVKILTIGQNQEEHAKIIAAELAAVNIRVETDFSDEKIGAKIRNARHERVSYILVVGEKEVAENKVAVRRRGAEDIGPMDFKEFTKMLLEEIKSKKLP
ncbi:MAG: threonine--tRNA ligase [Candidatus Firestonebacteria bacterium]|nr:threonine--tRNA ligase [Candidatus Firestonebacteria bacterium]